MPNKAPAHPGHNGNINQMLSSIQKGVDSMRDELKSSVSELDKRITVLESKQATPVAQSNMDMNGMMNMAMVLRIMERMFR